MCLSWFLPGFSEIAQPRFLFLAEPVSQAGRPVEDPVQIVGRLRNQVDMIGLIGACHHFLPKYLNGLRIRAG